MAQDEIVLKIRVEDGELKLSTATIDKQSKALDKNTKKKKQGTSAANRSNKAEKALYQTNLSGSKAFSKMNQTMGGSSGLVAAYATLAANVFAATAAFGALSKAAQFENLKKGLSELGAQSGRTLSVMAQGLRDITGGAISVGADQHGTLNTYSSDYKLKKNIEPIESALDKVLDMTGVSFEWKSKEEGNDHFAGGTGKRIGLIAQDVEKVVSEVVFKKDGYYGMNYTPLISLLIEAVKERQKQIDNLSKRLNKFE